MDWLGIFVAELKGRRIILIWRGFQSKIGDSRDPSISDFLDLLNEVSTRNLHRAYFVLSRGSCW